MMEILGLSGWDHFLNAYLNVAVTSVFVVSKYPDIPNHPRQRYKLTAAGKALRDKLAEF